MPVVNLRTYKGDDYVLVDRRTIFGNPYPIGKVCKRCGELHKNGGDTLDCYEDYLMDKLNNDPSFRAEVTKLSGKKLACWCVPGPCHAQILEHYADILKEYV